MDKFQKYFSVWDHPYRLYALMFVLSFIGSIGGNVLGSWLSN